MSINREIETKFCIILSFFLLFVFINLNFTIHLRHHKTVLNYILLVFSVRRGTHIYTEWDIVQRVHEAHVTSRFRIPNFYRVRRNQVITINWVQFDKFNIDVIVSFAEVPHPTHPHNVQLPENFNTLNVQSTEIMQIAPDIDEMVSFIVYLEKFIIRVEK